MACSSYVFSSSEYNSNNERNVNANGNANNNNKNNVRGCVPVRELFMLPRLVDQYTYKDILEAYLDCTKRKRNTYTAIAFSVNFESKLRKLLDEINSNTYQIGPSRGFVVTFPKPREVWAAQFRDRIVHHLVCRDLAPFYHSRFINTNCACIEGRGTLYATEYLTKFCRQATENWSKTAWALQFDIHNFFVSINRSVLWEILVKDIGETSLTSRLLKQIIFNNPTQGCIVKPGTNFSLVPKHKSLWFAPKDCGLPIGDLTSQLCASGVYLDGLDKFVKHTLKCKWYVRYVDDGVLLAHDKTQLQEWLGQIEEWLKTRRKIMLSPSKTTIKPLSGGINFAGAYILPFRTYPRKMTISRAIQAAKALHKAPFDKHLLASINSYIGMMRHANAFKLRAKLCRIAQVPYILEYNRDYTKVYNIVSI